jgi:predicted ArsR family transcriptional regulator
MNPNNINENETAVLDLIRYQGPLSVSQLCEYLGVTATAIRQRLGRLTAAEYLERVVVRQERGRPVHQYQMTNRGLAAMGENLADLAEVLWLEVVSISDSTVRNSVIDGVLKRLTEKYQGQISGVTITDRLRSIAALFQQRKIPFVVETQDNLSSLRIAGCPYPKLKDHSHEICQLEQRLVAQLLDAPVALDHCSCNSSGGQCCTFTADAELKLNAPLTGKKIPETNAVGD